MNIEDSRLQEDGEKKVPWKKWGPYLSERQWGTVREDYSSDGNAWNYFTHDQARSRAYRWGEDGLGGISDEHQILCFALALWNGKDPIIKERLFGLTNEEGNHGEDVKECYFYLDSTPTHSYMKYLYKYPQAAYPYVDLIHKNRQRSKHQSEYELIDTGIFRENRYFDVFVEYAKESAEDIVIKITACNRGAEAAPLHLLPTLWYRNTWSWKEEEPNKKPLLEHLPGGSKNGKGSHFTVKAHKVKRSKARTLSDYYLYCEGAPDLLFTENETNQTKLFGKPNASPYVKDGINRYVVEGELGAVNPAKKGTKVSAHYIVDVPAGESKSVYLRLTNQGPEALPEPFGTAAAIMQSREKDCNDFYTDIRPKDTDDARAMIMRQAFAGMLWSKQWFYYDVSQWLDEQKEMAAKNPRSQPIRNGNWYHMYNEDIISMPDKWEYPWFAAWDLAFHMIPLSMIDPAFAKDQLDMMLRSNYLHPNGQMPAYEWNFSDVNPPVHAWATMQTYLFDKFRNDGTGDIDFLRFAFSKLLMNFSWWVNRKDPRDTNIFGGGFLGLDNIGVFDRSKPLPTGGHLEQADGTAWMVFYSQQMLRIATELAIHDSLYEEFAIKFFDHTMWIAGSMDRIGEHHDELWDEHDGFFYDVLRLPDGSSQRLKVRSMVGLLPLMATVVFGEEVFDKLPRFHEHVLEFIERHPEKSANVHLPTKKGVLGRHMLAVVNEDKLRRILTRMLDEKEFLSDYGIRSLSKAHKKHPYVFHHHHQQFSVAYVPGESDSGLFGGNSNWRGPIWLPVNFLMVRELLEQFTYRGDSFKIEYPTGSGKEMDLYDIAMEIANRLINLFVPDARGERAVNHGSPQFQDEHWKDLILFYEYFDGDNGRGIGASHQTGWTALVARLIQLDSVLNKESLLQPNPYKTYMKRS